MKKFTTNVSFFALAASGIAVAQPAMAQSGNTKYSDNEIVVTAQRREELSRDVPITITSISAQQLETSGADSLADIAEVTPALRFDSAGVFVQPTIRGVGTAVANSGGGSNVGVYVDGFYSPNPISNDFELMNLKSVQVLKGPQGTLFGRNTTGGAILLTTADPSMDTGFQYKVSYGSFDALKAQGYVTTGLGDIAAIDGEVAYSHGKGFVDNIATGRDDDGEYQNWSVRTGLKIQPSDNIDIVLRYQHTKTDDPRLLLNNVYNGPEFSTNGGNGTLAPIALITNDPDEITANGPLSLTANVDVVQGTIRADLGFADLTSYTQYRDEKAKSIGDLDGTSFPAILLHLPVFNSAFTQEFLLTSKPGDALQWTAGLFYFNNKDTWRTALGFPTTADPYANLTLGGSGTTTRSYAAFLDATYEIVPNLFLTGGVRYSKDQIVDPYYIAPFSGVRTYVPEYKKNTVTPRVVLRYKPSEQSSIYASYSKGYKAGILDVGGSTGNLVQPEDINAFEVGYKYAGGALSFDISSYFYDYKNLQVSLYQGSPPSAQIINAADSEIYGLEGQGSYRFSDAFSVNLGAAYTHARYKKFNNAPVYQLCAAYGCGGNPNVVGYSALEIVPTNLTNVRMQRTPSFTANVGALYTVPLANGALDLSGNLYYTSSFYHGPSGTQFKEKAYESLSLRAQWTDASDHFRIAVFGNNVTDNRHRVQVLANTFGVSAIWNEPASWGAEVGFKF